MLRVGLTGGIACGKSRVLRRLAEHGFRTLDLDAVAHEVMASGRPAHAEVLAAFGPGILGPEGQIDRKALGAIVFADAAARARLNAIVHPRVRDEERVLSARGQDDVVVTDGALLVEAGVHLRFDRLVVVHCDPAVQLQRLRARDGLSEAAARARIDGQMPLAEKRRFAHLDVDTSGTTADTDRAADQLAEALRALLPRPKAVPFPLERAAGGLAHGPKTGPRQLTPAALLADIAETGGVEMERIARRLVPAPTGHWYGAGEPPGPGPRAEALMLPLVFWALGRGGPDPSFLAAAASSLGRLFHRREADRADACLFALVAQEVAVSGRLGADLVERGSSVRTLAERWGGALPTERIPAALRAAASGAEDPGAAALAAVPNDEQSALASSLLGLAKGTPVDVLPGVVRAALLRLRGPGSP